MSNLKVDNVTKSFGDVAAIKNVTINLNDNNIYGLLGRNGAGKTTMINLITNKLFPTSGQILVDNENVIENSGALSKIATMGEMNLYPETKKLNFILKWSNEFYANFDLPYAKTLAESFGLKLNKRFKELSTGYQTIFKNIVALAANTEILLLDEPVLGLDAHHRELFYKEMLKAYAKKPRIIVISTHLIEEVASIIAHVIIIKTGEIIADEPLDELLQKGYSVTGSADAVDNFIKNKKVVSHEQLGNLKTAYIYGKPQEMSAPNVTITRLPLQKLFIELTN